MAVRIVLLKRILFAVWVALFPLFFFYWYYPVTSFRIRVGVALILLGIGAGTLWVVWSQKVVRWVLVAVYLAALVVLLLPAKLPQQRTELRTSYVEAMQAYKGCPYVWGGEGYRGIDCSGLIRKGLEDALARQGLATGNPTLVREAIWLYGHDTTAEVLGQGYGGRTTLVTTCPSLNELDYNPLQPGDLAVTERGEHVMAYLGDKTWIAADPGEGKVTIFTIPEKANSYFSTPMKLMRWKVLTDVPVKN